MENSEQFVVMMGNLSEGFTAFGPYNSFNEAAKAHEYKECWIMTLGPAKVNKTEAKVVDIFNYKENWKNRP